MVKKIDVDWAAAGRKAAVTRRQNLKAAAAVAPVTKFQKAEEGCGLSVKRAERTKVEDFLLAQHSPKRPMCLFSLPATQWILERSLYQRRRDTTFVCVEREKRVYNSPNQQRLPTAVADFVLGDAATVLNDYVGITALWYDAMCALSGKSYAATIKALPAALDLSNPVPAVFTVQKGREPKDFYGKHLTGSHVGKRVRKLASMLSAVGLKFKVTDYRCYQSAVGSPMLNIFGLITKRTSKGVTVRNAWGIIAPSDLETVCETWPRTAIATLVGCHASLVTTWLSGVHRPSNICQLIILKTIIEDKATPPKNTRERRAGALERSKRKHANRKAALPGVLEPLVAALAARRFDELDRLISLAKERLGKIK